MQQLRVKIIAPANVYKLLAFWKAVLSALTGSMSLLQCFRMSSPHKKERLATLQHCQSHAQDMYIQADRTCALP